MWVGSLSASVPFVFVLVPNVCELVSNVFVLVLMFVNWFFNVCGLVPNVCELVSNV